VQEAQNQAPEVAPGAESRIRSAQGGGQPLPASTRAFFESHFGMNFSNVRLHTDKDAEMFNRQLNARAFTTRQHIFFRQGEYDPGSSKGRGLLAHELTHVVQQAGSPPGKLVVSTAGGKYGQESDPVAEQGIRMPVPLVQSKTPSGKSVQRQKKLKEEESLPALVPIQPEVEDIAFSIVEECHKRHLNIIPKQIEYKSEFKIIYSIMVYEEVSGARSIEVLGQIEGRVGASLPPPFDIGIRLVGGAKIAEREEKKGAKRKVATLQVDIPVRSVEGVVAEQEVETFFIKWLEEGKKAPLTYSTKHIKELGTFCRKGFEVKEPGPGDRWKSFWTSYYFREVGYSKEKGSPFERQSTGVAEMKMYINSLIDNAIKAVERQEKTD
jgi:hypothetical protein